MALQSETNNANAARQRRLAFVSHSAKDRKLADRVCGHLESAEIKCWIAPRDVRSGREYSAEIMRGITDADCLVLVLTKESNDSQFVRAEVERAYSKQKPIYTLRIGGVDPTPSLELFVSLSHRIDTETAGLPDALNRLALDINDQELPPAKPPTHSRKWILPAAALGLLFVGGLVFLLMGLQHFDTDRSRSTEALSPPPPIATPIKSDSNNLPATAESPEPPLKPAKKDHTATSITSRDAPEQKAGSSQPGKTGLPLQQEAEPETVDTAAPPAPEAPEATKKIAASAYSIEMVQRRVRVKSGPGVLSDSFAALNTGDIVHVLPFKSSRWKKIALDDDRVGYVPKDAAKPLN